jgi:general secretion pathway protein E
VVSSTENELLDPPEHLDTGDLVVDAIVDKTQAGFSAPPLSFSFARRHGVVVRHNDESTIATAFIRTGSAPACISEVRRTINQPLEIKIVSADEFEELLQETYESRGNQAKQMVEGLEEDTDLLQVAQDLPEPSDLLEADDDAPIIRLINAILTSAIKENASDIHIEPFENRLVVRFRIDGVMQEVLQSRRAVAPLVVSRIKVMSKLDIAEKRLPQDGRISLRIAGRAVDVRVSTMPSGHGERVVLRLLDKQAGRISLEALGMDSETQTVIDRLIHRPHGIILVTGPTGSGKTTSLYAALERINDNTRNIMTVEDPIEYYFDGIGQTQVNTKVDMTFARGLRAILRQDPDVVMVGEIRDIETAEIAIQASLTGHLVLSTLHTNTAVGAVTRLRDMGVEPFLLSSSLIGVVAQRLVRVLDPNTRVPYTASEYECGLLNADINNPPTLYHAADSQSGDGHGYRGRNGIYEMVAIDEELRRMIHDGAGEHELEAYARQKSPSIRREGLTKVLDGSTTLEEVLRVTRAD